MELREWTAAAVDPEADEGPPTPDEWVDVAVPGSPERFAGERAVAYRTHFADPGGMRALLRLGGLYAHARVWLNGDLVGDHDTYFTPFRMVFAPLAENELVVECRTPTDHFGGVFQTDHTPPAANGPGIRGESTVTPVPETVITDLVVRPAPEDGGVNAIATVDTNTDLDGRVRLSLTPTDGDGASALTHVVVDAAAGERVTVQGQLSVRDPKRWWPRGFGSPHRYTVEATLGESERETTTGFRTVERRPEGLFVNGTRIPARGRVVGPGDVADPAAAVERATATNATLLRCHGFVPPASFYDAADAAGLLLFQDLPVSAGALDVERGRLVARTLAGEYAHHPSLALVGVRDDAYEFDAVGETEGRHVLRATGAGGAATATAAASALPADLPAMPLAGLDVDDRPAWVLDGYADADTGFDAGAHTRYVVPGTDATAAARAERAVEALRLSRTSLVTAFAPADAAAVEDSLTAAFEPVHVVLDDPTATAPHVVVCNDTAERVTGEVEWTAGEAGGTLPVDVGTETPESVGEIEIPADAAAVELTLSTGERRVTNRYER